MNNKMSKTTLVKTKEEDKYKQLATLALEGQIDYFGNHNYKASRQLREKKLNKGHDCD